MATYILSIDQSTSASKIMLFDQDAHLVRRVSIPHRQYYPQPGMVEHNPIEIFNNVLQGIRQIKKQAGITMLQIAAIAITNQRETAMVWDKISGKPLYNAVVWQCLRGDGFCNVLKEQGYEKDIRSKTGLIIDPYFSASKLHWIINNIPEAREKLKRRELAAGTMDSWLVWKLTGHKSHVTDPTNACRTLLFDINTLQWDDKLVQLFDLHPSMLPEVVNSDHIVGYTDPALTEGVSIPIAGLMGDSHAAFFGQNCFREGLAKSTFGTGSSIMLNIGKQPAEAPKGLVTSVGFACGNSVDYVFEGNIHCTGDTISWLKNELQLIENTEESEKLSLSVDNTGGVYLIPAFAGLGAPYWDNGARAAILGMTRGSGKAHIARAALESIAYQVKDLTDLMQNKTGKKLTELRVDGGPTSNRFLMQFLADLTRTRIIKTHMEEISALGSTLMAGLAIGWWKNLGEIESLRRETDMFETQMEEDRANELYKGWLGAVRQVQIK